MQHDDAEEDVVVDEGHLAGWTAKRMSVSGRLFFQHDENGTVSTDVPDEAARAVETADEEEGSSTLPAETAPPIPLDPIIIANIQSLPGNNRCCDCGASGPTWASISYGILICLTCAGIHRSFGTSITVVKSLLLDNWSPEQVACVAEYGGNAKFQLAAKKNFERAATRYKNDEAELYRVRVLAAARNEPLPKTLQVNIMASSQTFSPPPSPRNASRKSPTMNGLSCTLCSRPFSLMVRRQWCRNCNRVVCTRCAPGANTKPLPQMGFGLNPVRHCSKCYRSPFIDWTNVPKS